LINYRVFENFEYSPALKIGLNKAIEELRKVGLRKIENDVKKKSIFLREKLKNFCQINFYENTDLLSGINTFNIFGINTRDVYSYLLSKNILSSISTEDTSYLYFKKRKIKQLVRISFHSYNTFKEINYLIKCLIDLIKKKAII
jgi:selenocysteine lyase/cysteine desulfurase